MKGRICKQALLAWKSGNAGRNCRHGYQAFQASHAGISSKQCCHGKQALRAGFAFISGIAGMTDKVGRLCIQTLQEWLVCILGMAGLQADIAGMSGNHCRLALPEWKAMNIGITGMAVIACKHCCQACRNCMQPLRACNAGRKRLKVGCQALK